MPSGLVPSRQRLGLGRDPPVQLHGQSPPRGSPRMVPWRDEAWPPEVAPLPRSFPSGADDGAAFQGGLPEEFHSPRISDGAPEYSCGVPEVRERPSNQLWDEYEGGAWSGEERWEVGVPCGVQEDMATPSGNIRNWQQADSVRALLGGQAGGFTSTGGVPRDIATPAGNIRNQLDSVGALLGGQAQQHAAAMPAGACRESRAGPFVYRGRDAGACYELEAELPGGRLLRVWRNPLKRTIVFEGEILSHLPRALASPQRERRQEQLHVQIPGGFDLQGPPMHVERRFAEGRCLVAVARGG